MGKLLYVSGAITHDIYFSMVHECQSHNQDNRGKSSFDQKTNNYKLEQEEETEFCYFVYIFEITFLIRKQDEFE